MIWFCLLLLGTAPVLAESRLATGEMKTVLLPAPLRYTVLLPDGYDSASALPLIYLLHGGTGDNGFLKNLKDVIEGVWAADTLPKSVVVTPDCARSFYMDYK